ncbi:FAD-dependent monooxygenase [Actinocrispum sp. NPDC049592]|uniref:FAD-dependent oxidoreductase n=1 Tax=Actinocrispum sp. NPDC049592 TaxID=3154835 RepID=UPI0034148D4E
MTSALIIGGGIAGAATAMALHKAGIQPTIYEAYPTGADDVGAFLTIMNNGVDALRAIDADQTVIDNSFPATAIEVYTGAGKKIGDRPMGNGPRTLTRATLYRVLHDEAARRGIPIEHGKRLVSVTTNGQVTATFEDGTSASADLLVGADGIHSTTRSLIDPDAPGPRYGGLNIAYGYTRDATAASPEAYRMIFGKNAFFGYTTAPDGETWWFARVPGAELTEPPSGEDWRNRLVTLFEPDDTPAAEIVAATKAPFASNAYDVPTTPNWHRTPMVLVGDAAHAASPAAGQGASMALEDSVILAQCVRDLPDLDQAFATYVRIRRARVERLVAASAEQGSNATPGPVKRFIRDAILTKVRKPAPESRAWLYDHHIEWSARITPPS